MIFKANNFFELELVFINNHVICHEMMLNNYSKDNIFKSDFWEKIFLSWIKLLFINPKFLLPKSILDKKSFSLSFEIVDNNAIAHLNEKWMRKKGPTDVLSFPIIMDEDNINDLPIVELGDIFISFEMAIKQSLEHDNSITKEMLWLASHGFLHLLGFDHRNQKELNKMLNLQEYLISELNLNN